MFHKTDMRSKFDNQTSIQNDDLISISYCTQSMCNNYDSSVIKTAFRALFIFFSFMTSNEFVASSKNK